MSSTRKSQRHTADGITRRCEPDINHAGLVTEGPGSFNIVEMVAPERLRHYTPFIEQTVRELIATFIDRGEVEFIWTSE